MDVNFFDDFSNVPKSREDVRFKQLGFYVYPDQRRIALGFDITPFLEKPSIEVNVFNNAGVLASTITVVQTLDTNFNLTLHLRDSEPASPYRVEAVLFYSAPEGERTVAEIKTAEIDINKTGQTIAVK